jgi:hypothetical protein
MYTLTQSINWAQTYIQYAPLTAGLGQEPAVSAASMIRDTFMSAPITWAWNRNTYTLPSATTKGTQDYTVLLTAIPDFGFLEKVALLDTNGKYWEITDIYNNWAMAQSGDNQRPNSACIFLQTSTSITLRFVGVPNAAYTVTLIYQKRSILMGPYLISSCGSASGSNTAYTGVFDPLAFTAGAKAQITGFVTNSVNNGSFTVVSCTATTLTVANAAGVAETITAYASNFDWAPIPDSYADVYNWLFLSESMSAHDDNKSQVYRQRGVASFLAKAEGLTEMQKKAFVQQWLARGIEMGTATQMMQTGNQARSI